MLVYLLARHFVYVNVYVTSYNWHQYVMPKQQHVNAKINSKSMVTRQASQPILYCVVIHTHTLFGWSFSIFEFIFVSFYFDFWIVILIIIIIIINSFDFLLISTILLSAHAWRVAILMALNSYFYFRFFFMSFVCFANICNQFTQTIWNLLV